MASLSETIAAIATPAGRGAIGVVRISGPNLELIAKRLINRLPPAREATMCTVRNENGEHIDRALAIYFASPRSFTGEDVLELQTHGGTVVTHEVLRSVIDAGARLARAGEFSERAFLNGKIDLIQAEAIADLIESTSSRAAKLAHKSLAGHFSRDVRAASDELRKIRVLVEAIIDFPEDEIPTIVRSEITQRTAQIQRQLADILNNADRGAKLNQGIDIAIVGRPNVGKSTLLNVLSEQERAIVTPEPGTTRDVLSVDVDVNGLQVRFHDTAGIHEAANSVEREGIKRALQKIEESDLIFHIISDIAERNSELLRHVSTPVFVILNKIDLYDLAPTFESLTTGAYLQVSAKEQTGIELIRSGLLNHFQLADEADHTYLARERHLIALRAASGALDFEYDGLYLEAPELAAEHLRRALDALGEMLGEYTSEDLLGDIFATFCIGK